jgi:hypothetical protein
MKLSAKLLFGDFGIPLFSFFEILTLNQNIGCKNKENGSIRPWVPNH